MYYVNPNWAGGERVVQCPYNPVHRFRFADVGRHLEDCRVEYFRARLANRVQGPIETRICKHDNSHILVAVEAPLHEEMCAIRQQGKRLKMCAFGQDGKRLAVAASEARSLETSPSVETAASTIQNAEVVHVQGNDRRCIRYRSSVFEME